MLNIFEKPWVFKYMPGAFDLSLCTYGLSNPSRIRTYGTNPSVLQENLVHMLCSQDTLHG